MEIFHEPGYIPYVIRHELDTKTIKIKDITRCVLATRQ